MRVRISALRVAKAMAAMGLFTCFGGMAVPPPQPSLQLMATPGIPVDSPRLDPALARASADVRDAMRWILSSGDNRHMPFAVVDKKDARLFVFSPQGRLVGETRALLGLARGDHSVPGIGDRELSKIMPHERTTPAGRFVSEPGRHVSGEHVVWIDYDAALSIHRLRPAPASQRRPQRLASADAQDRRISLGCVIVSGDFYDSVVRPTLGATHSVVYVLPETRTLASVFGTKQLLAGEPGTAADGASGQP